VLAAQKLPQARVVEHCRQELGRDFALSRSRLVVKSDQGESLFKQIGSRTCPAKR
jgi:hypothetical protein